VGSVRLSGTDRINYYPYGEERGTTANGREKFGTYFRDQNGLDYADQRYYAQGRFTTPDPSGAADPSDPGSWNMYAYAGGDPINYNDPEGLTKCGDYILDQSGKSLRSLLDTSTESGLFAAVLHAEAGNEGRGQLLTDDYFNERDAIASSILNRWRILNGAIKFADGTIPRGWGPIDATISQVLGAANQYASVTGGPGKPTLADPTKLNSALDEEQDVGRPDYQFTYQGGLIKMSARCVNVWQTTVVAYEHLSGQGRDPFAEIGLVTSFHKGSATTSLEPPFGNFGSANNFFGITWDRLNQYKRRPRPR